MRFFDMRLGTVMVGMLTILVILLLTPQPGEAKVSHHYHHHLKEEKTKKHHRVSHKHHTPTEEVLERTDPEPLEDVDDYLFEVYQRTTSKSDSSGDFTWKDAAAAQRRGLTLKNYVIGGMAPSFRKNLYTAGLGLDKAGLSWTILSGFRDDWRQAQAEGFKARVGHSWHGGSSHGGYGHGQAADIVGCLGTDSEEVWKWLDLHGEGLTRPMKGNDPAHVQSTGLSSSKSVHVKSHRHKPKPDKHKHRKKRTRYAYFEGGKRDT